MDRCVIMLSIPGLRRQDLPAMPSLTGTLGHSGPLTPSFPCVTWPVQTNMLTGRLPCEHGVVANGFYWRESRQVEMWTAWNQRIEAPQIWDLLHARHPDFVSAVWFPMLSKGCGADYVCMPAPVHHPDGSESLWCYTQPADYYGPLREALGDFPLQHFWGPLANIRSTSWIVDSAIFTARPFRPNLFYIYLPHLDYAAQKDGPDSAAAGTALGELDVVIGRLVDGLSAAYAGKELVWLAASEYTMSEVQHVSYPNRVLRQAGLLQVRSENGREMLDLERSTAWALVDHQFSHVFVPGAEPAQVADIAQRFAAEPGIAEVLVGEQLGQVRAGSSAIGRHRAGVRVDELAGVLLVVGRCPGAGVCADCRHSPQTGLRPGGAAFRSADAEHSLGCHVGPRFARRTGHGQCPAGRTAQFGGRNCAGRRGAGRGRGPHRVGPVRNRVAILAGIRAVGRQVAVRLCSSGGMYGRSPGNPARECGLG